jgi:hypothetical protein
LYACRTSASRHGASYVELHVCHVLQLL